MNPILRLVFCLTVSAALLCFGIWRLTPDRSDRAGVWSQGFTLAALALLVVWLYWDVLT